MIFNDLLNFIKIISLPNYLLETNTWFCLFISLYLVLRRSAQNHFIFHFWDLQHIRDMVPSLFLSWLHFWNKNVLSDKFCNHQMIYYALLTVLHLFWKWWFFFILFKWICIYIDLISTFVFFPYSSWVDCEWWYRYAPCKWWR